MKTTRVMAISSGKGGVGKTNVSVNLAIALGQAGRTVLLLDADLGLANVDVILGISPRYTLEHVIDGRRRLEDVVVAGPPNVRIIPGGSGLRELVNLSDYQRQELIESVSRVARDADYLLIDTAAGIASDVSEFVLAADEVLVVTTPDPTAITDAYALIKVIAREPVRPSIHLVVNQAANASEALDVAQKIAGVAGQFLQVSVDSYGYLPTDSALSQAVRRQTPALLAYPQSPFSRRIYSLARRVTGQPPEVGPNDGVVGFLRRIAQFTVRS